MLFRSRIGHLGFFNDLTLCGTLCGVEMGLAAMGVPHRQGINAALSFLADGDSVAREQAMPARSAA